MTATAAALPRRRLTTSQAADRVGVDPRTIVRWCNAGHLPCWRTPGGQRRIDPADLDTLLREVAR